MAELVLAADLGGTNLRLGVVDESGAIIARTQQSTPNPRDGVAIVDAICKLAEGLIGEAGPVRMFGIAAPAVIDQSTATVTASPNIPGLNGMRLAEVVGSRLSIAATLENDANAAAVGEHWLGSLAGATNAVCVTLGTGVGGGLILNGKLFTGADGTAGEIGHICVEPDGVSCECGSRGCLEQYASAAAIIRMSELESGRGVFALGERLTSQSIYEAARGGDQSALQIFNAAGFYIGVALAGIVNALNPEVISIGGGVAEAWNLFIHETRRQIDLRAFQQPAKRVKLVRSRLGDNAGLLGAAKLAFEQIGNAVPTDR
ncbi:MAG: ROK family protein [Blastocatellia bacterium]|nr:ROK family protein [Blastocatellia bacterium]